MRVLALRLLAPVVHAALLLPLAACLLPCTVLSPKVHTRLHLGNAASEREKNEPALLSRCCLYHSVGRRDMVLISSATLLTTSPHLVSAAEETSSNNNTINELLSRIKRVPAFCIVNSQGIPYMAVKMQDRMAKGYAFTSFQAALVVLADAQRAAQEGGYTEVWNDATVTVLPMDIAMRLALQKRERSSQKDLSLGSVLELIPTAGDRQDGLDIDKFAFRDQGHVPLFYLENGGNGETTSMFFEKATLLAEWNRRHPELPPPRVKVVDLVYAFEASLRGYTDKLPPNMVFVPSEDALAAVKELKSRGQVTPYKLDEMII